MIIIINPNPKENITRPKNENTNNTKLSKTHISLKRNIKDTKMIKTIPYKQHSTTVLAKTVSIGFTGR